MTFLDPRKAKGTVRKVARKVPQRAIIRVCNRE
jgi:hypothetical protein